MGEHGIPQLTNGRDIHKKRQRWDKIELAAVQQSGSSLIPEIAMPISMDDIRLSAMAKLLDFFFTN